MDGVRDGAIFLTIKEINGSRGIIEHLSAYRNIMVMISNIEQIQDDSIFMCKLIGKDKSMNTWRNKIIQNIISSDMSFII